MDSKKSDQSSADASQVAGSVANKTKLKQDATVADHKPPALITPRPTPKLIPQTAQPNPIQAAPKDEGLHASELNYRRLFETAQDGILILDAQTGRVTDVNPFLIKLLGFAHKEMVGKTVGELSPFQDIVSNQAMLELQQNLSVR